jgi:hypothetical protein
MSLTNAQRRVYDYCGKNEFVSVQKIEEFSQELDGEGNLSTLSFALEKFRKGECPQCNAQGAFKWHFMGKHQHPECGASWYISPGAYAADQFKGVFRSGMGAAASAQADAEKKNDKAGGCLGVILGFFVVALYRLVFGVLMIPIQAIFSLTQSKHKPLAQKKGN